MGQVITFPIHATQYPDYADDLDAVENLLLVAVRGGVGAYRRGEDPVPHACEALATAGMHDAAFSIDGLMSIVAGLVRRPVHIYCVKCPNLSHDEKQLLHAASLTQNGDLHLVEKVLRTTLLSAEGAAFAVGRLEGLGTLFARARLLLARRPSPVQSPDVDDGPGSWSPPQSVR